MHETTSRQSAIPVILSIDVEPDEFYIDRNNPKPWAGYEYTHDYLNTFRKHLEETTNKPVHFNWFLRMDPQIAESYDSATWIADRYPDYLEELRTAGDELGFHVHTYRWSAQDDGWVDDCGNSEWVSECLQSSAEAYQQTFGNPGRALRFGNFWLSTRSVNEAESLGVHYDLTIEPGLASVAHSGGKPIASPTPAYHRVPRKPYQPSTNDFRQPLMGTDRRTISMIPLTSAYIIHKWNYRDLRHRLALIKRNGLSGSRQCYPLSMWREWKGRNSFSSMIDRAIKLQKRPYLAFAIRTDINGRCSKAYHNSLEALLNHPLRHRFVFCTPSEALNYL